MKNKIYWIVPENNDHITSHLFLDYDNKVIYIQHLDMNNFFNWKSPEKIVDISTDEEMDNKAAELIAEIKLNQYKKIKLGKGEVL